MIALLLSLLLHLFILGILALLKDSKVATTPFAETIEIRLKHTGVAEISENPEQKPVEAREKKPREIETAAIDENIGAIDTEIRQRRETVPTVIPAPKSSSETSVVLKEKITPRKSISSMKADFLKQENVSYYKRAHCSRQQEKSKVWRCLDDDKERVKNAKSTAYDGAFAHAFAHLNTVDEFRRDMKLRKKLVATQQQIYKLIEVNTIEFGPGSDFITSEQQRISRAIIEIDNKITSFNFLKLGNSAVAKKMGAVVKNTIGEAFSKLSTAETSETGKYKN